jgi:hypothetical protein
MDILHRALWRMRCAFGFAFKQEQAFVGKYALGGLFILICAPIGWLLALGYRTEVGYRLLDGVQPALPDWSPQSAWRFLQNGMRAGLVILAYYSPYLLCFWLLGTTGATSHWPAIAFFVAAVVILPPVGVSLMPTIYCWLFSWVQISPALAALLAVLFLVPTFLLPAAFMQVLQARSFLAARRLDWMVAFICGNWQAYLEAWAISALAAVIGLLMLPLAPWGLFWSYPAITYAFQSIFQPQLLAADAV